jgi:hypothetical protein
MDNRSQAACRELDEKASDNAAEPAALNEGNSIKREQGSRNGRSEIEEWISKAAARIAGALFQSQKDFAEMRRAQ